MVASPGRIAKGFVIAKAPGRRTRGIYAGKACGHPSILLAGSAENSQGGFASVASYQRRNTAVKKEFAWTGRRQVAAVHDEEGDRREAMGPRFCISAEVSNILAGILVATLGD
jgi:hypothetical protein